MQRDDYKCIRCGSADKTLNVHHAYYVTGRMPWQYPSFSLSTLCYQCHKAGHESAESEEDFAFEVWEQEIEWLLRGDPKNADALWDMAAHVIQWSDGHPVKYGFDGVVEFIRDQPGFLK